MIELTKKIHGTLEKTYVDENSIESFSPIYDSDDDYIGTNIVLKSGQNFCVEEKIEYIKMVVK